MLKTFFDWVLTLNLIVVTGVCVYLWWTGTLAVQINVLTPADTAAEINPTVPVLFAQTLREEVDRQLGQPAEGYTPAMLLQIFPGMVATDFEDVEASQGKYVVVEGQLVHVPPPNTGLHSAATAITNHGFKTLLLNIAARGQIDLTKSGTLTAVMNTIGTE